LQAWILKAVGPKQEKKKKKHKAFHDEDEVAPSHLFKEIHALRHQHVDPKDADALERAKYTDGIFGRTAGSKVFEFSTLGMISLNALAIGVDADYSAVVGKPENLNEGPLGFIIVEWIFAIYFTSEVLIRFLAYKKKCDCLCDAWFVFDSFLVSLMVIETWVLPFLGGSGPLAQLSILRLLRLLRITRMARLMRAVPEMMVIIKGMVAATRTVCCTGALLVLVLYIFSILFTDAYHEPLIPNAEEESEAEAMFGTMGKSMFSLFIMGTVLDDVTQASNAIRETKNYWMLSAFVVFILISSFMMLNMLIGVLVEVVGATAEGEREKSIETNVREAIGEIFGRMDADSNKSICRSEFLAMRKDKSVMEALKELDITGPHFHLYAELFFRQENGVVPMLTYEKLVSMILRLRPGSFVSALDFAAFAKAITGIHDRVKDRVIRLENLCEDVARPINTSTVVAPPDIGHVLPPPSPTRSDDGPVYVSNGDSLHNQVCAFDGGSPQLSPKLRGSDPSWPPPPTALASPTSARRIWPPKPPLVEEPAWKPDRMDAELMDDADRMERTTNMEIVEELQRRLGIPDFEKTGVPYSMMDEEMQRYLRAATERQEMEAFMTLGVPDNDSETVYV